MKRKKAGSIPALRDQALPWYAWLYHSALVMKVPPCQFMTRGYSGAAWRAGLTPEEFAKGMQQFVSERPKQ